MTPEQFRSLRQGDTIKRRTSKGVPLRLVIGYRQMSGRDDGEYVIVANKAGKNRYVWISAASNYEKEST